MHGATGKHSTIRETTIPPTHPKKEEEKKTNKTKQKNPRKPKHNTIVSRWPCPQKLRFAECEYSHTSLFGKLSSFMSSFVGRWKKEARIILVLGNYQSNVCVGFV